jgi:hypothetical protein
VKIADGNVEYAYSPSRIRIKAGTTVTDLHQYGRHAAQCHGLLERQLGHRPSRRGPVEGDNFHRAWDLLLYLYTASLDVWRGHRRKIGLPSCGDFSAAADGLVYPDDLHGEVAVGISAVVVMISFYRCGRLAAAIAKR